MRNGHAALSVAIKDRHDLVPNVSKTDMAWDRTHLSVTNCVQSDAVLFTANVTCRESELSPRCHGRLVGSLMDPGHLDKPRTTSVCSSSVVSRDDSVINAASNTQTCRPSCIETRELTCLPFIACSTNLHDAVWVQYTVSFFISCKILSLNEFLRSSINQLPDHLQQGARGTCSGITHAARRSSQRHKQQAFQLSSLVHRSQTCPTCFLV